MPAVQLTVLSGQAVSSAFAFPAHFGGLVVAVPSHSNAWGAVRLEFTSASGTAPFGPYLTPEAATLPLTVWSGAGPGWGAILQMPTPYGRLAVSSVAATTMSFSILPLTR